MMILHAPHSILKKSNTLSQTWCVNCSEKNKNKKARDLRRRHQSFSFLKLETEVSVHLVRGSVSWVEKWQSSCFPPLRHNNSLQISDVWLTVP